MSDFHQVRKIRDKEEAEQQEQQRQRQQEYDEKRRIEREEEKERKYRDKRTKRCNGMVMSALRDFAIAAWGTDWFWRRGKWEFMDQKWGIRRIAYRPFEEMRVVLEGSFVSGYHLEVTFDPDPLGERFVAIIQVGLTKQELREGIQAVYLRIKEEPGTVGDQYHDKITVKHRKYEYPVVYVG
jgi:hypothetical protein